MTSTSYDTSSITEPDFLVGSMLDVSLEISIEANDDRSECDSSKCLTISVNDEYLLLQ